MNRRGFLGALGAATISLASAKWSDDPDRALWVRRRKLISIPKPFVRDVASIVWHGDAPGRRVHIMSYQVGDGPIHLLSRDVGSETLRALEEMVNTVDRMFEKRIKDESMREWHREILGGARQSVSNAQGLTISAGTLAARRV